MRTVVFLILCTCAAASTPLENGSFDDQTYGKDGVVLLYDNQSVEQLAHFLKLSAEGLHFWHLDCEIAPSFCDARADTLPTVLFSFRNEQWSTQSVKTYDEHAFETFVKSKVQENCVNTRRLCSAAMNETLAAHGERNHTEVRALYEAEKEDGDAIEKEWNEYSEQTQREFMEQRAAFQERLRESDERLKVLGQLMEAMHATAYSKQE